MAIDLDLLKQATKIVFDATERVSGRSRREIGRGTSLDDLGLTTEEIIRLFLIIRESLPPGLIKFTERTFLRAKTVGEIVDMLATKRRRVTIEAPRDDSLSDVLLRKSKTLDIEIETASSPKKAEIAAQKSRHQDRQDLTGP